MHNLAKKRRHNAAKPAESPVKATNLVAAGKTAPGSRLAARTRHGGAVTRLKT
jgi:hypothetical protein